MKRRHHGKRRFPAVAAVLCAALGAAAVLWATGVSYAVYMNGTALGAAGSRSEVAAAVDGASEKLSLALGYDYDLSGSISVSAALTRPMDADALEDAILREVPEVVRVTTVTVDGEPVGAARDGAGVAALLDGYLARYSGPDTISAAFLQEVRVEDGYAASGREKTLEELDTLLDPENLYSAHSLTVVTVREETVSEPIPHGFALTEDPSAPAGERTVTVPGADGEQLTRVRVTCEDGIETSRSEPVTEVLREPVTEELTVGTLRAEADASRGSYIWPATGVVTSLFGPREAGVGSGDHQGLDIGGVYGQEIRAADAGTVISAGYEDSYGNVIRILHDNGHVTWYAHCSELWVAPGQRVAQGEPIAAMGATGDADGEHVHFEIRVDGVPEDPLNYLPW